MTNMTRASKFLALVLRHKPDAAGVILDDCGWVDVNSLLNGMANAGTTLTRAQLESIVKEDTKGRYVFSVDGKNIRATQGHSVNVELGLKQITPPDILYHGTGIKYLESIKQTGLDKRSRQFVHLSENRDTALEVGKRHGKPVVLTIKSREMCNDGLQLFQSENNVWLTDNVPTKYIIFS